MDFYYSEVHRRMRESKARCDEAYERVKEAQARLDKVRAENEPKIAKIQARREVLRRQRDFCMMMAMLSIFAPVIIVALIGFYRSIIG